MNPPQRRERRTLGVFFTALFALANAACSSPTDPTDDPTDDPGSESSTTISVGSSGSGVGGAHTSSGAGGDDSLSGSGTGSGAGGDDAHGTTGAGCGPGSTPGTGGSDGGDDDGAGDDPPVQGPSAKLAQGVRITKVVLNQGVRHTLMDADAAIDSNVPVIAGRPGLVRVFYETDADYNGESVKITLELGGVELSTNLALGDASSDGDMQSTANFSVQGNWITPGLGYRVAATQVQAESAAGNPEAGYPAQAQELIDVEPSIDGLKVVLVPITYQADGSGRAPDTSAAQLESYTDHIYRQFPVADVSVSVRAPVPWNGEIDPFGDGWSALLNAIADLRAQDLADDNTYYYGIFTPRASFQEYCAGGCVTGLGFVSPALASWSRASIGLGYTGDLFSETAVHELGHNHGRTHAPCGGPAGPDDDFPHDGGMIGAWGYALDSHELKPPSAHADFMSYCNPAWVSDYTYSALHDRISFLSSAAVVSAPELQNRTYDRVAVGSNDELSWLGSITLKNPPRGERTALTVGRDQATSQVDGEMIRYDHLPGGVMFVPRPKNYTARDTARSVEFTLNGRRHRLAR